MTSHQGQQIAATLHMQHEHHRVPVTALAFWSDDVVLTGEGSSLKAYDTQRKTLLAVVEVLPDQAIHGIITESGSIFVWGGAFICQLVARYDQDGSLVLDVGPVVEAEDWILDASFSPASPQGSLQVALVTAHNSVAIAVLSTTLRVSLESLVPGSNCILYAAHVKWLSPFTCLIASGTAFGDVIVWSCSIEKKNGEDLATHQTHYTFSAHEGSVFGVNISSSSIASALGGRKHILASCSDDRTIRLWDISDLTTTSSTLAEEQRQTGFGSKSSADAFAPLCLGKVMGHVSRVWHVRFVQDLTTESHTSQVHIVSFGEDATCITWVLEASNYEDSTYSMKQLEAQKAHAGKNIWSVAIDRSLRVATGGADGSVVLRSFNDLKGHGAPNKLSRSLLDADDQIDNLKTYAFINRTTLIATTHSGKVTLISFANGGVSSEHVSDTISSLHGYSTMASVPDVAFAAGTQGFVYAYVHGLGKMMKVVETASKVAGLFSNCPGLLNEKASHAQQQLLVTNVASYSALFCQIQLLEFPNETDSGLKVDSSALALPPGFVVTSFAHATHLGLGIVVLGSRSGSIAVFASQCFREGSRAEPKLLYSAVHGKEAVTSLCFIKDENTHHNSILFLSTGRDGTCACHKLLSPSGDLRMQTVHQISLPFGPNVEGIGYSLEAHLWIWGFRSKQFVVWDVHTQQEVMKVECGGANRNWAFQLGENGGSFVWTKASKVYYETHGRLPFHSINSGGHGREIKSLAISPTKSPLIATGAEDTDIKLSTYSNGVFKCLHTLQKHNTGIQHLQWSTDGCFLFSSGGFEEFYVWKITYDVPALGIGVVGESAHPNSGASDLRIMHFGAQKYSNVEQEGFDITMVYSDSSVRAWRYVSKTWSLLAAGNYLTSCLTQCLPGADSETSLITGSTDGCLGTWRTDVEREILEWDHRHQVHQSAILSLVSHELVDGYRLIITGGDDNALGITRMSGSVGACRTLLVPRAHAAAVTALAIVEREHNHLRVVSSSIDQHVKLWQIDIDTEQPGVDGIDIKLLQNSFTAVADVSSIDAIQLSGGASGVLVCGVGMDVWKAGSE